MILTNFCFPDTRDGQVRIKRICSLCHIEQNFHLDCGENTEYITCTECYKFIQGYFNRKCSLFEIIRFDCPRLKKV